MEVGPDIFRGRGDKNGAFYEGMLSKWASRPKWNLQSYVPPNNNERFRRHFRVAKRLGLYSSFLSNFESRYYGMRCSACSSAKTEPLKFHPRPEGYPLSMRVEVQRCRWKQRKPVIILIICIWVNADGISIINRARASSNSPHPSVPLISSPSRITPLRPYQ